MLRPLIHLMMIVAACSTLTGCAGAGKKRNVWNDVEYNSRYQRDNDSGYTLPGGYSGCMDDAPSCN